MQFPKKQHILITILGVTVHRIAKNSRKKLDEGKCSILRDQDNYFVKVNSFMHNLRGVKFAEVKYNKSISYFFYEQSHQNCVNVLSVCYEQNTDELLDEFNSRLSTYSEVEVTQLSNMHPDSQLYKRVEHAYPDFQTKQVQSNGNAMTKISKELGGFVGTVSNFVTKPFQIVGNVVQDKKQKLYKSKVNGQTKNKWENVKNKAQKLNDSLTDSFKPVSDKAKKISNKIGHSFNHSNNSVIKAIRNFGLKTQKALNQGYKQGMKGKQKPQALKSQTDSDFNIKIDSKK